MPYPTIESCIGNTPLVRLQRLGSGNGNTVLVKLEGNNPAGSVKDRPALSMILRAEERGEIRPGDTLIEATSGNTGIALAMVAAIRGYRMILIMPENLSVERRASMRAYGAELRLVTREEGLEGARDLALAVQRDGVGIVLDQFANPDNPRAHYETTGPEIWRDTGGTLTHFVSAMGTTGTIMGTARYLREQQPRPQIVGVQPAEGAQIPGIRRWPPAYVPSIFDASLVDREMDVTQEEAEETTRRLAAEEGIFCGISSGGSVAAALRLDRETRAAVIVAIVCDRGDRYLFAIARVPDTAGARRLFDLEGLDDADVAKVLAHRRRQQTGASETLRWDQEALAGITLVQHSMDKVQVETLGAPERGEPEMLEAFYRAALREGRAVSWDGEREALPLIHFRSLCHSVSFPAYWQTRRERGDFHLDLVQWLAVPGNDTPGLDETACRLGFPGLAGLDPEQVVEAWLAGEAEPVQTWTALCAVNAYLVALRLFGITGQVSRHDGARAENTLREYLARRREPAIERFLAAWEGR